MGLFSAPKHLHLVGIKGVGMTALAQILLQRGHHITGSDVPERFFTDEVLQRLKIQVNHGFAARNVPPRTQVLIYSAAFGPTNAEIREAKVRGIRTMVYPEALGELSKDSFAIGVSGMHGKSTTTAMLGQVLVENGVDPTVVVGTRVPAFNHMNARVGAGRVLLAETCEYRRHFLYYCPNMIVLTNVEPEHLDYFRDLADIEEAYLAYISRLSPWRTAERERLGEDGKLHAPTAVEPVLVACVDDPGVRAVLARLPGAEVPPKVVTYGFDSGADCRASELRIENQRQVFDVAWRGEPLGTFNLAVPGKMNVRNALASIAATYSLSSGASGKTPSLSATRQALASFTGTTRRFEIMGQTAGITVIDDYAHHPTEIRATIEAARQFYPQGRLFVDFMSHTYSRTRTLLGEFATCFTGADAVVVNDIYPSAREERDPTLTGEHVAAAIAAHHPGVTYAGTHERAADHLLHELKEGDVLLIVGAGDSWKIGELVLQGLAGQRP